MNIAAFLIARRPMHPEHAEHFAVGGDLGVVRLEADRMPEVVLVVRCRGVARARLRIAMALMRLAGRIGRFKSVQFIRKSSQPRKGP